MGDTQQATMQAHCVCVCAIKGKMKKAENGIEERRATYHRVQFIWISSIPCSAMHNHH